MKGSWPLFFRNCVAILLFIPILDPLWLRFCYNYRATSQINRPVVPGGAMALPDFGRSVNLISTKGADYAHQIMLAPTDFKTFRRPWSTMSRCILLTNMIPRNCYSTS